MAPAGAASYSGTGPSPRRPPWPGPRVARATCPPRPRRAARGTHSEVDGASYGRLPGTEPSPAFRGPGDAFGAATSPGVAGDSPWDSQGGATLMSRGNGYVGSCVG